MRLKLTGDEILSTGKQPAGTEIALTATNAVELLALASMFKGVLLDEQAVAAAAGDVGPALASYVARQPVGGVSLSSAAPPANAAAGTVLGVLTLPPSAAVTLQDSGGGRVQLQGQSLVATSTPFTAGQPIPITIVVNAVPRTFTLYPATKAGTPNPTIPARALLAAGVAILAGGQYILAGA